MKRHMGVLAVLAFAFACFSGAVSAGQGQRDSYDSALLGRKVNFTVYLPDNYSRLPGKLPAIYLLHGLDGDEMEWLENGAMDTVDFLIRRKKLRPMVIIMPSFGEQSWWADGARDKAESALLQELLPYVERKYRVYAARAGRALAGWSMGAYGALNIALRHPERFCAAGVISPEIYDPLPAQTSGIRRMPQFMQEGAFDPELWRRLNYPAQLSAYGKSASKVPFWIATGDDDRLLGLVPMATQLHGRLAAIQPRQVELRVIDGELDWTTVRRALPDMLQYIDRVCQAN